MAVKKKLASEYKQFRKDATWYEFAFWCVGWILMVYALVSAIKTNRDPNLTMILEADTVAAFMIPVFHFLLPKKIFLARISYRAITWVLILTLGAGFIGKFLDIYKVIASYDSYLHVFGCFFLVFACYEMAKAIKNGDEPLAPVIAAICGFGLSFFAAVSWEIFEFTCDQFFNGNTQNWAFAPSQHFMQMWPMDIRRYALVDTMTDLICGTVGSIFGGAALFIFECYKVRKSKLKLMKKTKQKINSPCETQKNRVQA
ncbi:MAG: hypothetical protein WCN92_01505 [Eubacteriales bacterium]